MESGSLALDGKPWKIWMDDNNSKVDWMGLTYRLASDKRLPSSLLSFGQSLLIAASTPHQQHCFALITSFDNFNFVFPSMRRFSCFQY